MYHINKTVLLLPLILNKVRICLVFLLPFFDLSAYRPLPEHLPTTVHHGQRRCCIPVWYNQHVLCSV